MVPANVTLPEHFPWIPYGAGTQWDVEHNGSSGGSSMGPQTSSMPQTVPPGQNAAGAAPFFLPTGVSPGDPQVRWCINRDLLPMGLFGPPGWMAGGAAPPMDPSLLRSSGAGGSARPAAVQKPSSPALAADAGGCSSICSGGEQSGTQKLFSPEEGHPSSAGTNPSAAEQGAGSFPVLLPMGLFGPPWIFPPAPPAGGPPEMDPLLRSGAEASAPAAPAQRTEAGVVVVPALGGVSSSISGEHSGTQLFSPEVDPASSAGATPGPPPTMSPELPPGVFPLNSPRDLPEPEPDQILLQASKDERGFRALFVVASKAGDELLVDVPSGAADSPEMSGGFIGLAGSPNSPRDVVPSSEETSTSRDSSSDDGGATTKTISDLPDLGRLSIFGVDTILSNLVQRLTSAQDLLLDSEHNAAGLLTPPEWQIFDEMIKSAESDVRSLVAVLLAPSVAAGAAPPSVATSSSKDRGPTNDADAVVPLLQGALDVQGTTVVDHMQKLTGLVKSVKSIGSLGTGLADGHSDFDVSIKFEGGESEVAELLDFSKRSFPKKPIGGNSYEPEHAGKIAIVLHDRLRILLHKLQTLHPDRGVARFTRIEVIPGARVPVLKLGLRHSGSSQEFRLDLR